MAESAAWHRFKNLCLFCVSLAFFPIDTFALFVSLFVSKFQQRNSQNATRGKRILVTGVSMSKGLAIARLLHRQGHTVIGADRYHLSSGRVSRAIRKFYLLPKYTGSARREDIQNAPYVMKLLDIVVCERIDLWIPASDVNGALHDGLAKEIIEARTSAKAIQLGFEDVATLDDKGTCLEFVKSLGLTTPDTKQVSRKVELQAFLEEREQMSLGADGTQYLVKPIGVNDVARYDMPLLPLPTEKETMARLNAIPFDPGCHYIVQEFIKGDEYCTHALIVRGQVRAFVACPSSGLLMHYTALPRNSPLTRAMLEFTKKVAEARGKDWTAHISFDFLVRDSHNDETGKPIVYPIECNPRVHTAVLLLNQEPKLVDEYLAALGPDKSERNAPLYPARPHRIYWVGQDLVESVLYPAYETLVCSSRDLEYLKENVSAFLDRVCHWKDGIYEVWDPVPFWWTYHVQWPLLFLGYLVKGKWHKANVSTGKLFEAA